MQPPSYQPVFTPSCEAAYTIDKFSLTVFSSNIHQGLLDPANALRLGRLYALKHNLEQGRTARRGNPYVMSRNSWSTMQQLLGAGSFSMIVNGNGNRRLRHDLHQEGSLREYEPGLAEEAGNVIDPNELVGMSWNEIPELCQATAAHMVGEFRAAYADSTLTVLGITGLRNIRASLTSIEVGWDIAHEDPRGLIASFESAFKANLLAAAPVWRASRHKATPVATPKPSEGMLIGFTPRFKIVAYPKLVRSSGLGMARFEFRLGKKASKNILGSQVLPDSEEEIRAAFSSLAAYAWPYLVALDADRLAPQRQITPHELLPVIGGCRNQRRVLEVLGAIGRERKVKVTAANRPLLKRLTAVGLVSPLHFPRPAYRRLTHGVDLGLWSTPS